MRHSSFRQVNIENQSNNDEEALSDDNGDSMRQIETLTALLTSYPKITELTLKY